MNGQTAMRRYSSGGDSVAVRDRRKVFLFAGRQAAFSVRFSVESFRESPEILTFSVILHAKLLMNWPETEQFCVGIWPGFEILVSFC